MDSDEIIEMDELVIVGSRYSKDLKDRLQPIYEAGEPMSAEELGRLLKGDMVVISPDMVNQFDPYALDVRTQENKLLGRVWWYQSFAVSEWMENQNVNCIKARIKRVNTRYGLIFAEVRGMKLTCRVRDNFSIDTDWANFIPDRLPCCGGSSLEVSMFLLRECLLEKDVDMKQLRLCFDNLLQDLPADLSAQNYEKCMELNQLMKNSPNAEVREMRDLLLHTFVERGSEQKMELWVNRWLSELFLDAAESELLAIFKAANYTLERVEELLNRAPGNLFYLYQVNRVRFAFQLYYLALPKEVYNRLLTLLAVRELMLGKEIIAENKDLDAKVYNALATLKKEGEIVHLYDFTWPMIAMNEDKDLPSFDTPTSYLNYMKKVGIKNLPSRSTISKYYDRARGQFPNCTFDDADTTETIRRNNVGKRFINLVKRE